MRTNFPLLAIALLFTVHCGGTTDEPSTQGDGGAGGSAAGTGGADTGGTGGGSTGGTGGTGGIGTGGSGATGGNCALGGAPPWCEGDVYHPGDPMCGGPAPTPVPCGGDTPLCNMGCSACPGAGGAPMVSIGATCVDSTEVTRADYDAWLASGPSTDNQAAGCDGNTSFAPDDTCMSQPDVCSSNCSNHPQTCVDWCDAAAFCASVGKRLCAQFPLQMYWQPEDPVELGEACHDETLQSYPYGADLQPTACNGSDLGAGTTVPVASLTGCARTYGNGSIYDLVGNVWEWQGICDASGCTARGGSYAEPSAANTCSAESDAHPRDYVATNLGFRCCAP